MRLEVHNDERLGEGGFLRLRRLRLVNLRDDGSRSRAYACDFVERPLGLDAVAVVLFARDAGAAGGVRVLLRDALRPALDYGRSGPGGGSPWSTEVVAGLLEAGDEGEEGVRRRAAIEVDEEAGFCVAPEAIRFLGNPAFASPGVIGERIWLVAAEVDPASGHAPSGDGSPMEEGGRLRWLPLAEAIAAVRDAKTELALRRLSDYLAGPAT